MFETQPVLLGTTRALNVPRTNPKLPGRRLGYHRAHASHPRATRRLDASTAAARIRDISLGLRTSTAAIPASSPASNGSLQARRSSTEEPSPGDRGRDV